MKRILLAVFVSLLFASPSLAQFAESQTSCHGCTPAEIAHIDMIRKQEMAARNTQPALQAIGGPVGPPTIVVPPAKGSGFISIGRPFGDFLEPYIDAAVQALIAALISWVCWKIKEKTGVEIDQKHQEILTKALSNQAGSLIADGLVKVEGEKISVPNEHLAAAADEVMKVVPDVAKHFGLTPDYVAARIVDTIPQIAAGAQLVAAHATAKLKNGSLP